MFVCRRCGISFDEPGTVRESRGEFWGSPCYEEVACCPSCHSDYIEWIEDDDEEDDEW